MKLNKEQIADSGTSSLHCSNPFVACTCFFVGMHNKPNMMALDSQTMTGKVIDEIIKQVPIKCIKTNLVDVAYFPKDIEFVKDAANKWYEIHKPEKYDVIVLLGRWVSQHFDNRNYKIIKLTHPAGVFGPKDKFSYIKKAAGEIMLAVG